MDPMDPAAIGFAAATLLGAKATEEFGAQAGSAAWQAAQRLGSLVRSRMSPDGERALDSLTDDDDQHARELVEKEVTTIAAADGAFRTTAEEVLEAAERDERVGAIIAIARGHAHQVNHSGGGTIGTINM